MTMLRAKLQRWRMRIHAGQDDMHWANMIPSAGIHPIRI